MPRKPAHFGVKNFPYLISAYVSADMEETLRLTVVALRSDRSKVMRQAIQEWLDRTLADPQIAAKVARMR